METEIIVLNEFCTSHHVEISFIQLLEEHGLIETVIVDQSICVYANELPKLERIIRLHQELNINPEGIDVINELLKKMNEMHHEITALKNRLDFYTKES